MTYQIIFFDLDGTLIDPKTSITSSVQYALSKFNINEELETLIPFIGPPLNKSFQKFYNFNDKKSMQAVVYFREHLSKEGIHSISVYKGIIELLEKLKKKNKKLVIVTSKSTPSAIEVLEYVKLKEYFDAIIGCKLDLSNADKPSLVKEALSLFPERAKTSFVMVGDKEHDIIGAQANSIDSIGVLYGYGSNKEIEKSKPTYIAKTIDELTKLLTRDQV